MHHAIVFNYFESGTQTSDLLDMSQFHKIFIAKFSYRKGTENIYRLSRTNRQNMLR